MRRTLSLGLILIAAVISVALVTRDMATGSDPVTISAARAVPSTDMPGVLQVFMTFENGAEPNRIVNASSPEAETARFGGRVAGDLVLPAESRASLSGDGVYLELSGVEGAMDIGRLIPVSLEFDRSGTATTRALIGAPEDPHGLHDRAVLAEDGQAPLGAGPAIEMTIAQEGSGWIVTIETRNFSFVPDAADPVHVPGEGHGHLYLNGVKLQRMYADTAVIGALPPGEHVVEVSLNTNTHQAYRDADGPVAERQTITVD